MNWLDLTINKNMGDYNKMVRALEGFITRSDNKGPDTKARTLEAADKMKGLLSKHLKRINYSYLRSVFFPEFSKGARYPTKFPVTSNTYQVRSTFTIKVADTSLGILFDPMTVSNSVPAMYIFNNNCTLDDWGRGTPYLYNGRPAGKETATTSISSDFYFQRSRLIGASIMIQPVNFTGGVWRSACEYDAELNPTILSEKALKEELKFQSGFANFFNSMSFDLFRALKSVPEFLAKLEARLQTKNLQQFNLDTFLTEVVGEISYLSEDEYKKNKAKTLIADQENMNITVKLFRFFWTKKEDRTNQEKGELPLNQTHYFSILARVLAQFGWTPYYRKSSAATEPFYRSSPFQRENQNLTGSLSSGGSLDKSKNLAKEIFDILINRWNASHAEALSRMTRELCGSASVELPSTNFPGGPLNFARLQECHYFHDTKGADGIRALWVPNKEAPWNDSVTNKKDYLLIGGEGIAKNTMLTVSVVRHYEGITVPGLKDIFPGHKEFPDERVVRLVSAVHTLYPQILDVSVPKLAETYSSMKKTFKWFDLIIQDRGGYMSIEKPLPIAVDNLSSSSVNQMLASGAGNSIEEID